MGRIHTVAQDDQSWRLARILPPPGLAADITGYADYAERTASPVTRRELPHAEGVLILNLGCPISITDGQGRALRVGQGQGFIAGVHLVPAWSHSSGAQSGLHVFLPLATLRRLGARPMTEFVDRAVDLTELLGPTDLGARLLEAPDLAGRIAALDTALASRLCATPALCRQQRHALHALRHRPTHDIAAIADEIGWSRKHLASRVRDAIGIGPRSWRRLLRFQHLVHLADATATPHWAGLAHAAGYSDQPHMIREFREFTGLTPTNYRRNPLDVPP